MPFLDQERYPDFERSDRPDRIDARHEIRYSLINYLSRKRTAVAEIPGPDGLAMERVSNYNEFFRFRLEQAFDIREAERTEERDMYQLRPFSDLLGHVSITPWQYISLNSRSYFSFYESDLMQQELYTDLTYPDLGVFTVGYTYYKPVDEYTRQRDTELNMLDLRARLTLPYSFLLSGRYQMDIFKDIDVIKELILTYRHQCYDVSLRYADTRYDTTFSLWFTILGFSTPHLGV